MCSSDTWRTDNATEVVFASEAGQPICGMAGTGSEKMQEVCKNGNSQGQSCSEGQCCACTCQESVQGIKRVALDTWEAMKKAIIDAASYIPLVAGENLEDMVKTALEGFADEQFEQVALLQKAQLQNSTTEDANRGLTMLMEGKSQASVGWDCG